MSLLLVLWPNNQARESFPAISRIPGIPRIFGIPGIFRDSRKNLRKFVVSREVESPAKRKTLVATQADVPLAMSYSFE